MDLIAVQHLLPRSIRTIMALIGTEATEKLIGTMAGVSLLVPMVKTSTGRVRFEAIAECIGRDAAEKLCKHFGGATLEIATCRAALVELQWRAIRAEFDTLQTEYSARQSYNILAGRHGMTGRQLRKIIKLPDAEPSPSEQLTLL